MKRYGNKVRNHLDDSGCISGIKIPFVSDLAEAVTKDTMGEPISS